LIWTSYFRLGQSVKWVSQQLGHRSATLTLDTYNHALPDEEADLSYLPGLVLPDRGKLVKMRAARGIEG
jgi:hypothetical protein